MSGNFLSDEVGKSYTHPVGRTTIWLLPTSGAYRLLVSKKLKRCLSP